MRRILLCHRLHDRLHMHPNQKHIKFQFCLTRRWLIVEPISHSPRALLNNNNKTHHRRDYSCHRCGVCVNIKFRAHVCMLANVLRTISHQFFITIKIISKRFCHFLGDKKVRRKMLEILLCKNMKIFQI